MASLGGFLKAISAAIAAQSASRLSALFCLDVAEPAMAQLQNDLVDKNHNIADRVAAQKYFAGDWQAFGDLVVSYLALVRDVDAYDIRASYDLYESFFADLQTAFSNRQGGLLTPLVARSAGLLTDLAIALDGADGAEMARTGEQAKVLLKIFNSIRADRTPIAGQLTFETKGPVPKRTVLLYIAGLLCRTYFRLNQPPTCVNVFSNMHTAGVFFSKYPMSQRVTYRYYLGRFYLFKNELVSARKHLLWAFEHCHRDAVRNQRLILTFLVPTSVLLGVFPKPELLSIFAPALEPVYAPMIRRIRAGDLAGFKDHITQPGVFDFLVARGLYTLLRTRAEVLVFRNLFFKIDKMRNLARGGDKKPHDLRFDDLLAGLRLTSTHRPPRPDAAALVVAERMVDWTNEDVENVCVTLIDQKFMKGNIYARSHVLRLSPKDPFSSVSDIYFAADHTVATEEWMDR
ncbi:uncharacterized protein V1510DRAFT_417668, partial [Dipodascopsis tothii]|uniref:uncharacterized protein n=1 Tax=Dipodascopsis tothii TaxID=44089 RepID=UPI0034CFE826